MDYIIFAILTFLLLLCIIYIVSKHRVKSLVKITYSQSAIHEKVRPFIPQNLYNKPELKTQAMKHVEQHMIKIIVIDGKAYWVKDNIFYTAETRNGNVIPDTAHPVDTSEMSKQDMDKMLFILDNLGRRKRDDSSSTGNE